MTTWEYFFFILGLCSLAVSVFNWDWYYTYLITPGVVRVIGRTGARIVYALVGLFLVLSGLAGLLGLVR